MLDTGHDFSFGCVVGSELIGDHDTRCDPLALQELSHHLQGRLLAPAALDQSLKNITIGIDGPPQPVFSALDSNAHFVEMPLVGKTSPGPPPDGTGIFSADLGSPFRDSLERDFNATLSQQIFYMTQAQPKADVEPHRMRYDLSGKTKALQLQRSHQILLG
jgi:hypothetical protein